MALKNINPLKTLAWKKLLNHFNNVNCFHLKYYFKENINRYDDFSIIWNEILLDYSKTHITKETIFLLINLANSCKLKDSINKMFSGDFINKTEKRAVLHTSLRSFSNNPLYINNKNIIPDINNTLDKMEKFSQDILLGNWRGYNGDIITDVVNLGIGGSDLGPIMVIEALKYYKTKINIHFVSNIDATDIIETIKKLKPENTLFIISSKTFKTQETITNAKTAKNWFLSHSISEDNISKHFIAISTNFLEVKKFGINSYNIFSFWDWVGGRYSLWGPIGLSICLAIGFDNFKLILSGANHMDEHFKNSPFDKNIPVILALLGIWYINFFNINNHLILPYDQYLHLLPSYLQQIDMESNGKSIDREGNKINYSTGPVVLGEVGTKGQHSFYQSIYQGTNNFFCDFIISLNPLNDIRNHHIKLFSNFIGQSKALAFGNKKKNSYNDNYLKHFKIFKGNTPSNSIVFNKLTPYLLGNIIAMYEHKIFVQGVIWNIFSFDQWGVELGKKFSNEILSSLTNENKKSFYDSSTIGLINLYKKNKK